MLSSRGTYSLLITSSSSDRAQSQFDALRMKAFRPTKLWRKKSEFLQRMLVCERIGGI